MNRLKTQIFCFCFVDFLNSIPTDRARNSSSLTVPFNTQLHTKTFGSAYTVSVHEATCMVMLGTLRVCHGVMYIHRKTDTHTKSHPPLVSELRVSNGEAENENKYTRLGPTL